MRPRDMLLTLVLAGGAALAGAQGPAGGPLDGKTFRSVDELPGGERPDGTVGRARWEVRFKGLAFTWRHSDKVTEGTYTFDPTTGTLTVKGGPEASFDAKTGILTWGRHKYAPVKDGK